MNRSAILPALSSLSADLTGQSVRGTREQTQAAAGSQDEQTAALRSGWYVRALTGTTHTTETFARPAVDALTALLLADALRRNRSGWRIAVRRYGTTVARQRTA